MHSIKLQVSKEELIRALKALGVVRRRRFSSSVPVWVRFIPEAGELQLVEDRGDVTARVPATGDWPVTGATVDLFSLRRATEHCPAETIDLHATLDAVMVFGNGWSVRLGLLAFGPESDVTKPPKVMPLPIAAPGPEGLPLFHWAHKRPQQSRRREAGL